MLKSSTIQSLLRSQANILAGMYERVFNLRQCRQAYFEDGLPEQAKVYTPYINKLVKKIAATEETQRELKAELQEAYWNENHGKTWTPLEVDDAEWLRRADEARLEGNASQERVEAFLAEFGKLEPISDEV